MQDHMQLRTFVVMLGVTLAGGGPAMADDANSWLQAVHRHEAAVAAARSSSDPAALGKALADLCSSDIAAEQWPAAEAACREALPLVVRHGPKVEEARVHARLAAILRQRGDAEGADAEGLRAIEQFDALGDGPNAAVVRIGVFQARLDRGLVEPARDVLRPAIRWYEAKQAAGEDQSDMLCRLYGAFADTSQTLGKFAQAEDLFKRALRLAQQRHDPALEAEIRDQLGDSYSQQGKHAAALEQYEQVAIVAAQVPDVEQQGMAWAKTGESLALLERREEAIGRYRAALVSLSPDKFPGQHARIHTDIGMALDGLGRRADALPEYQTALALRRTMPDKGPLGEALQAVARSLRGLGRNAEAVPVLEEAAGLWRDLGRSDGEYTVADELGAVFEELNRHADALRWRERALEIALASGPDSASNAAESRRVLARSLKSVGRVPEALSQLQQALDWHLAERAAGGKGSDDTTLRRVYRALAVLYEGQRQFELALPARQQAVALARAGQDRAIEADELDDYALLLGSLARPDEALAQFDVEIALRRQLHDPAAEASAQLAAAAVCSHYWREEAAAERYRAAIAIAERSGDRAQQALGHLRFARSLQHFGRLQQARAELDTAEQLIAGAKDTGTLRAEILRSRADLLVDEGRGAEALRSYDAANRAAMDAGDVEMVLDIDLSVAGFETDRSNYVTADARCEAGLALVRRHDWQGEAGRARFHEARFLDLRAFIAVMQGPLDRAQQWVDRLHELAQPSADPWPETSARLTQGHIYLIRGRYEEAIASYRSALDLPGGQLDRALRSSVLNDVAIAQTDTGRYDEALASYREALEIARSVGDRRGEVVMLDNLATLLLRLGQLESAEAMADEARVLAARLQSVRSEAGLLASRAEARERLGRVAQAEADFVEVVRIAQRVGSVDVEGDGWMGSGRLAIRRGATDDASRAFGRALQAFRRAESRYGEAEALAELAKLEAQDGRDADARRDAGQALVVAGEIGAKDLVWRGWEALAIAADRGGQVEQAIFFRKQAVNAIQGLRAGLTGLDRKLQRSLLDDKTHVYRGLADDLIGRGRLAEAEQVMAMLKEEEYFDFVRRDAAADPRRTILPASAAEAPWSQRYADIGGRVVALGQEYQSLRAIPAESRTPEQQARFEAVKTDLDVARAAFNAYLADIDHAFRAEGGERLADYAAQNLDSLRAQQATLARLGTGAVLVHFLVLPEKLHILVTTPTTQVHREVVITAAELNRRVFEYRDLLQSPVRDPQPAAKALYDLLVAPIAADLAQAEAHTLMLSLDGSLRYLPFAALHDGHGWLVQKYAIALYTPAGRSSLERMPQADWRVAGLGVSQGSADFAPLPAVPVELDEIVRTGPDDPEGILPGSELLDERFSADAFVGALEENPPVVHIASHFNFASGADGDSYLLLGGGRRLTLAEFKAGNFPLGGVDLLTLSACQTALGGGTGADGREVEGFGALAQNQGAAAVLATLWSVADGSTGLFMREFYRRRQQQHVSKAEAMRSVQQAFITGELRPDTAPPALRGALRTPASGALPPNAARYVAPPDAPYSHPFYWGPFILMGNWL